MDNTKETGKKQATLKNMLQFAKVNAIMFIAIAAALISMFFIPPDKNYAGYFDYKTLCCLFSMLAVVCALRNIHFFTVIAQRVIQKFKTLRKSVIALIYITFIGSMFMANDMALLTFLPLGYYVLKMTGKQKHMAYTFILQNIAANLGGMLTPFGNPQNLYLYSKFNIPVLEFMLTMLPCFLLSVAMITACCFVLKNEPLLFTTEEIHLPRRRTAIYIALFSVSIIMVFRVIPYYIGTLLILAVLLLADRSAIKKVDYPLLFTFTAFFVFAGNIARIDIIKNFFAMLPNSLTLLYSTLSCQLISNVPSALLLSQFTDNYKDLLIGVNIGGVGTLIASLASLITFRTYNTYVKGKARSYFLLFSLINFAFLAILLAFSYLIKFFNI